MILEIDVEFYINLPILVQVGLFTGTILFAILGASFGSLATLFTKDADVLGIVRTGVLVRYNFVEVNFSCCCEEFCILLLNTFLKFCSLLVQLNL